MKGIGSFVFLFPADFLVLTDTIDREEKRKKNECKTKSSLQFLCVRTDWPLM
jgi:hypothetical protein